jgi:DNA-binding HxlR family transcriptional regulator
MRRYDEFCPLARALDVVGERWTLLIIRELTIRDSRYSDLRDALPGVATNLLAERLRHLEAHDILERYQAPRPISATIYRLTPRGRALEAVVKTLAAWGLPLLTTGQDGDAFRGHWLALSLPILFDDVRLDGVGPLRAVVRAGDEPVTVEVDADGRLAVRPGPPSGTGIGANTGADIVEIEGEPAGVFAMFAGWSSAGVEVRGKRDAVQRLRRLTAARTSR